MGRWIDSSRRFKEFTTQYRSKIHKKIRLAQSDPAIQDLTAELDVAYQLLQQKQFTVAYEPYSSEKVRNPDFAVIFKYYLRLSGILTRTLSGQETTIAPRLWLNNQAKHPLTNSLNNTLQKAL